MLSQIDETLRPLNLGISTPVRYSVHLKCIKVKLMKPLGNQRLQFKIKAMDDTMSYYISAENLIEKEVQ